MRSRLKAALAVAAAGVLSVPRPLWALGCETDLTLRVSVGTGGAQAERGCHSNNPPDISADGRYVVFLSDSPTLLGLPPAPPNFAKLFVHDRATGTTEVVSVSTSGAVSDREDFNPAISGNGRYVVFESTASNLIDTPTQGRRVIYLRDRQAGTTEAVSVDGAGALFVSALHPDVSDDGRYVAFATAALFVRDRRLGQTLPVSAGGGAPVRGTRPSLSADGRYVAFMTDESLTPSDTNGDVDAYVQDRLTRSVTLASPSGQGGAAGGVFGAKLSKNGRFVVFHTRAGLVANDTNGLDDVYLRDLVSNTTTLVSVALSGQAGNRGSETPSVSADGRFVSFVSLARDLIPGGPSLGAYVRDRVQGQTRLVSLKQDGRPAFGSIPVLSADGQHVLFISFEPDVVPGDTNQFSDVFVRDLSPGTREWVENGGYRAGDLVLGRLGGLFECLVPGVGWCDSREPGADLGWEEAWRLLAECFVVETFELSTTSINSDGAGRGCSQGLVNLTATISNDSPFPGGNVQVGFYVATAGGSLGTLIGSTSVPMPPPFETTPVTFAWRNPPPGSAQIRAVVDHVDQFPEVVEDDNGFPAVVFPGMILHTCNPFR